MDSHFGQRLSVELDTLLGHLVDEHAVLAARLADSRVQADDPEGAEVALLLFAIHVGMLTGFDDTLLRFNKAGTCGTVVTFR